MPFFLLNLFILYDFIVATPRICIHILSIIRLRSDLNSSSSSNLFSCLLVIILTFHGNYQNFLVQCFQQAGGAHAHDQSVNAILSEAASLGDNILLIVALCFHSVFEGIAIGVAGKIIHGSKIPQSSSCRFLIYSFCLNLILIIKWFPKLLLIYLFIFVYIKVSHQQQACGHLILHLSSIGGLEVNGCSLVVVNYKLDSDFLKTTPQ